MLRCDKLALAGVVLLVALVRPACAQPPRNNVWEGAIARFEQADAEQPPPPGGIVFVGSSSIRLWNLERSFPGQHLLNRGFGGSHLADSVTFAPRIVVKYRPRLVLLYAGDNDLAAGKTPESIHADFCQFVGVVHTQLPETRIVYLSIKPSPARAKLRKQQDQTNRFIADEVARDSRLIFLDLATPLLGADGQPRRELYLDDGLHLSEAGYALWSERVRPLLE